MNTSTPKPVRHLILILGDQLDPDSAVFDELDPSRDHIWMAETHEEATHVWSHKLRLAFFFSAMRHFRDQQRNSGRTVHYHELTADPDQDRGRNFAEILTKDLKQDLKQLRPEKLILVRPGDFRVKSMLTDLAARENIELEWREDRHFYQKTGEFDAYATGKKSLVYWLKMPEYAELNALDCGDRDVPRFFWDGETDMACVKNCMSSVIQHGWSHHIPRLMVLGQFSLLLGIHPYKFHAWHMAMYVDAIDWVSLPNTLGMSQYGDGGIVGTKPYCASGNYIQKMSNYCKGCRYNPKESAGGNACPFTTLYWDFLDRNHTSFANNRRMTFQIKNLERKSPEQMDAIRKQADQIRRKLDAGDREWKTARD
ncbi:MAG: cryptochrome/photolyase family protein [Kiritimatiellia bacterium]